jgi:MFS family permease
VELGGVSVYLSEIATKGNKGFYCSWQSGSQQVAVVFAALIGVVLNRMLPADQMTAWGWRVPFLIGCLIVPFLFIIRRSLKETDEFLAKKHRPSVGEIFSSMLQNWGVVLGGMGMVIMTTVSFYMITAYTPTFGKEVLKLSSIDTLIVTVCIGVSNLVWLPVSGAISDRIGRRPVLLTFTILTILTSYPAVQWLVADPSFARLLMVELWLSFLYGCYNGGMVVALTEVMPVHARHRDVPDPLDGQQGGARPVDERSGRLRPDRDARVVSHAGSAQSISDGVSGRCQCQKQNPRMRAGVFYLIDGFGKAALNCVAPPQPRRRLPPTRRAVAAARAARTDTTGCARRA